MLNKILEIIKINIKVNLAYAINAWGAFVVTLLQIFVFYYIWMAIYKSDSVINGINKNQIVTYIILSRIIYTQLTCGFIPRIGRRIQTGDITMDLLKPMDFQFFMFYSRIGDFISFFVMTAVPVLLICALFFQMQGPLSALTFVCFILSLLMAISVSFFVEYWIGLLTFYTNYSWGLQTFQEALVSLFSGALIPLTFFPGWLRTITDLLPFQQMSYSPVSIYLGIVKGPEVLKVLGSQFLWIIVLYLLSKTFYSYAIKKITVQGG